MGTVLECSPHRQHCSMRADLPQQCECIKHNSSVRESKLLAPHMQRVEAAPGRLLLCTAELDSAGGRKLWMRATLRDRPGGKVPFSA